MKPKIGTLQVSIKLDTRKPLVHLKPFLEMEIRVLERQLAEKKKDLERVNKMEAELKSEGKL